MRQARQKYKWIKIGSICFFKKLIEFLSLANNFVWVCQIISDNSIGEASDWQIIPFLYSKILNVQKVLKGKVYKFIHISSNWQPELILLWHCAQKSYKRFRTVPEPQKMQVHRRPSLCFRSRTRPWWCCSWRRCTSRWTSSPAKSRCSRNHQSFASAVALCRS